MKNTIQPLRACLFLLALSLFSVVAACSDDDEATTPELTIPEHILTGGMSFVQSGGTQTLNVQSNVQPKVSSSAPDWCSVTPETSQSKTIYKYSITAAANTTTADRTATITVEAGTLSGTFSVIQLAADGLVLDTAPTMEVTAEGGTVEVKLSTNGKVAVEIESAATSWIKEAPASRAGMEQLTKNFVIAPNYGTDARQGTIAFTLGTLKETVTIKQAEGSLPDSGMESDATELAAKMFAGINIGNTMEVPGGETGWGNPKVNKTYIDGLKELGFNAVRIPCAWDSHIIDRTTNEIDPAWLERVSEVVGYCVANDMYAIVNIHWDGGWLEESVTKGYDSEVDAKQRTLWTQIATKLNVYDEHLLFAGCNEPGQQDQNNVGDDALDAITRYEQTFIDAVRATGGNNALRCLIVQGPYTSIDRTVSDYKMPTDVVENRLMVEVHFYDPYQFCLMEQDANWGNVFWYWGAANHVAGSDHNATWGEESLVTEQFAKMKAAYADKGIPVIVGEYSAMKRTISENQDMHNQSRAYWNEVVTREAKNHGCVPFYWETGGDVNRNTGAAKEAYAIEGIMKGASAGKYPY